MSDKIYEPTEEVPTEDNNYEDTEIQNLFYGNDTCNQFNSVTIINEINQPNIGSYSIVNNCLKVNNCLMVNNCVTVNNNGYSIINSYTQQNKRHHEETEESESDEDSESDEKSESDEENESMNKKRKKRKCYSILGKTHTLYF